MTSPNVQTWADDHVAVFTDIATAVSGLEAAMRHATSVGNNTGDGPALTHALRATSDEAGRCVTALAQASKTPPIPDVTAETLFRDMISERRMWANQIRKAVVRRDVGGMDRANAHALRASDLDRQLEAAFPAAWPTVIDEN